MLCVFSLQYQLTMEEYVLLGGWVLHKKAERMTDCTSQCFVFPCQSLAPKPAKS